MGSRKQRALVRGAQFECAGLTGTRAQHLAFAKALLERANRRHASIEFRYWLDVLEGKHNALADDLMSMNCRSIFIAGSEYGHASVTKFSYSPHNSNVEHRVQKLVPYRVRRAIAALIYD